MTIVKVRRAISFRCLLSHSTPIALDALRVLLRCLKYENERKDARLQMLESKIIENDLIPMLIHLNPKHDEKILHHALK